MRVHLVDGTFELFRAYFSKQPGTLLERFRRQLTSLLKDPAEAVTHLAIAFDNPIRSFRNDLFAGYKSDEGIPDELRSSFDAAEDIGRELKLTVWSMREFEADDALATAAFRFAQLPEVAQVRILTPDKDMNQCVQNERVILVDRIRKVEWTEAKVLERRGVEPASIPDYLALVGDDADGIPGLKGFGEKSAAKLLSVFKKLEAIPMSPKEWNVSIRGAEVLAATLHAHRQEALLYRTLATLRTDVPLRETLSDLAVQN